MFHRHALPCTGLLITLALVAHPAVAQQGRPVGTAAVPALLPAGETSVVILTSDQVIEGRVERQGREFFVHLAQGVIRLRLDEVQFVCRDLHEGYVQKRAKLQPNSVDEHLELARWCQTQRLYDDALGELDAAEQLAPGDRRIQLLEHRLRLEIATTQAIEPGLTAAGSSPMPVSSTVQPPAAESPGSSVSGRAIGTAHNPIRKAAPRATADGGGSVPPAVLESFTSNVQPILINNCTTSGCHAPVAENRFQVAKFLTGHVANPRQTQRNLESALQFVDRDDPIASELLKKAVTAHGSLASPPLGPSSKAQIERLLLWIQQAASPGEVEPLEIGGGAGAYATPPASAAISNPLIRNPFAETLRDGGRGAADATSSGRTASGGNAPLSGHAPDEAAAAKVNAAEPGNAAPASAVPAVPASADAAAGRAAAKKTHSPKRSSASKDELDPEIFNRQTVEAAGSSVPHANQR